jgi:hypothetical protein
MPVALSDVDVTIQGDMALATATAVVTDDKGTELSRETITAEVNKDLRADDPKRRGLKVDAKDRLAQLLAEQANAAEAKAAVKSAETAPFADLQALTEARITHLAKADVREVL